MQQSSATVRAMWRARFDSARAWLRDSARDSARDRYWRADGYQLPRRLRWPIWAAASALFLITYSIMWSVVHVRIDQRPCALVLDDPLFHLIPYNARWFWLTHQLYTGITLSAVTALVGGAIMGDHRPLVTWGTALGLQAVLRSTTLILLPLCRFTVAPGTRVIDAAPSLNLGLFSVPWRAWATNDLVFSGHVGEFLLLYWVTRHWPPVVRIGLALFQVIQIYALLATRGHYTIDIVVAVPCALFEFRLALWLLLRSAGHRSAPRTA